MHASEEGTSVEAATVRPDGPAAATKGGTA